MIFSFIAYDQVRIFSTRFVMESSQRGKTFSRSLMTCFLTAFLIFRSKSFNQGFFLLKVNKFHSHPCRAPRPSIPHPCGRRLRPSLDYRAIRTSRSASREPASPSAVFLTWGTSAYCLLNLTYLQRFSKI